ncbi:MAG TPA: 3-deoxy-D-manno-octulosonic acid transferase [Candidatus Deferrimicrobiaceae bacterium]|nr:3-deoxy-D-manno-octulosonic acid transferase [Candidatus Deferrimicrobiaceae bacterium]
MRKPGSAKDDGKGKRFHPGSRAHLLYNLALKGALVLASPAWIPWVAFSKKRRKNFPDRLGFRVGHLPPRAGKRRIWIHAVSVGETLAAVPLVRMLREKLPSAQLFFSTVTLTGQEVAGKALGGLVEATFFFPFDLPGVSGKVLDRVVPDVVAILETEIWPNFLGECARRKIPVIILNGRISERSFRGYGRVRSFFAAVLSCVTALAMQTEEDARRIVALGADPEKVSITGNMKFDVSPPPETVTRFLSWLRDEKEKGAKWFVAGSTHDGEEEAVLFALGKARSIDRSVRLLLAPRHPERFRAVEELCGRRGWSVARKSRMESGEEGESAPVVLLDTVGELLAAYSAADIAFVGGSLVPKGGHNILEPALFGVPTVTGNHMDNFREIAEQFTRAGAVILVRDAADLSRTLSEWAADPSPFLEMGKQAKRILEGLRGATEKNAALIAREISSPRGNAP